MLFVSNVQGKRRLAITDYVVDIVDATEVVIVALSEPLRDRIVLLVSWRLDLYRIDDAELGLGLGDLRGAR